VPMPVYFACYVTGPLVTAQCSRELIGHLAAEISTVISWPEDAAGCARLDPQISIRPTESLMKQHFVGIRFTFDAASGTIKRTWRCGRRPFICHRAAGKFAAARWRSNVSRAKSGRQSKPRYTQTPLACC
jgi:hypothetical protein